MPVPVPVAAVPDAAPPPSTCYVVGRDTQGHWVAVEVHGQGGGLFRTRHDAIHYAVDVTDHRPNAVLISTDLVELRI